jgi:hypothetical protein
MHPAHGFPCKDDMAIHEMSTWKNEKLSCSSEIT